jgi:hypothetical protein
MTTLNKTLDELKFEFSDMTGFLQDAFSTEEKSLTSIKNNVNQTNKRRRLAKLQNITGRNGIDGMTTKFSEAQNVLMKKTASEIATDPAVALSKLEVYDNTLPYGLPPVIAGVNEELREVKEKTWDNFSNFYGKIFRKVGKAEFEEMIRNTSHLSQSDVKNMIYSTCGSLSEWPQINPKSAGMGRCSTLFQLFNKHYMGYTSGGTGGIKVSDFYHDLISSLHTAEIYGLAGKNKPTTITGFSNKIETYNINTELWFLSDKDKEEAKYNGFATTGEDSYGKFFDIGGFPYRLRRYNMLNNAIDANGNLPVDIYIRINQDLKNEIKKNNGAYIQLYPNNAVTPNTNYGNNNNIIVKSDLKIDDNTGNPPKLISKKICSLFLNEGQTADINKLEKIEYPIRYLFNTQEMYGILPLTCLIGITQIFDMANFGASSLPAVDPLLATYITTINPLKNIFCYNQKIPEIGVLLFVRKIFQELYPVQDANPAVVTHDIVNIFQSHLRIVNPVGGVNASSFTTYGAGTAGVNVYTNVYINDTADIVSKKLLKVIEAYSVDWPTLRPVYYKKFIEPLIKLIRESPTKYTQLVNGVYTRDYYVTDFTNADYNHIITQPLLNMTFPDIPGPPVINHALIQRFFTNGGGAVDSLTLNIGAVANNAVPCVLMYRYIMYALIFKYVSEINSNQVGNNRNKYNLYSDDGTMASNMTTILTLTESLPPYNNLSLFKQQIPDVNPVMKGGKSKGINKIKTGGSKKNQKGGARDSLFVDTNAGNQGAPRLYANRRLQEFDPKLFKNAVKKYKELNFNSDYATVKALFDKISHCSYLPLFFDHFEDDILNITQIQAGTGGCGVAAPAAPIPLSFSEVAQLFLFNCVNTTTTTLLIHFFKNVKACLNHFVTTDLKEVENKFGKNIANQQTAKIEGSFRELNKELDKLINFLKYNTLNLQEQTINLNDNGAGANPNFVYNANEHYVKNLFLGANVYFSYLSNANQFVVMRLTDSDLGDPAAAAAGAENWQGTNFFNLLNRIVGCTESSDDFTKTIQFLTDNRNDPAEYGLQTYLAVLNRLQNPLVNNRYLQKIRPHIKDKPDGCFGGIPFVSLDPKIYKLLMLSYYFLLKLRLVVGEESKKDQKIVEEEIFSELSIDKQREIMDTIKSKLTASAFSGLASSLTSNATLKHADLLFESFYLFLFNESNRLIEEVKKAEQLTKESSKNKSKKSNLFAIKGGQSTSIYSLRPKTNSNNGNLLKKQIDFIKTKYQASSKFDFIIETLTKQLKKQIELKRVRNNLHFFYYIDTHFRNFKIYMETVLLTIGEKNIPPEVSQKLQKYVGYTSDKSKYKESFTSLKNSPLVDPQYSDPLWWANIERKFMSIQKQGNMSDDVVYRLFIITTTPTSGLKKASLRDMYIVDAFNLATLNDDRSKIDQPSWFSTGYRTHAGIKSVEISQKNSQGNKQFVYSDSNTVIKLTGIQFHDPKTKKVMRFNTIAYKTGLKNMYNKLPHTIVRTNNEKINEAVYEAIHPDIIELIHGRYLYYDKNDNKYKKLIPLFLQGSTNAELNNILTHQQQLKYRGIKEKFRNTLNDYKIYQMEDEKIQNLKEFRKWLYLIFMEQQMSLAKKDDDLFTTNIQKTMKQAFNNLFGSDITGKCARVYNIYDFLNGITLNPQPINPVRIKCSDFDNFDLGSVIIEKFISRESLIKLMLLY